MNNERDVKTGCLFELHCYTASRAILSKHLENIQQGEKKQQQQHQERQNKQSLPTQ